MNLEISTLHYERSILRRIWGGGRAFSPHHQARMLWRLWYYHAASKVIQNIDVVQGSEGREIMKDPAESSEGWALEVAYISLSSSLDRTREMLVYVITELPFLSQHSTQALLITQCRQNFLILKNVAPENRLLGLTSNSAPDLLMVP